MKRLKQLCWAYLSVLAGTLLCDRLLFHFTGIAFKRSTIWSGGKLIVSNGVAYQNYWREEVLTYSIMFFIIATVIALVDDKECYSSAIDKFLRSKKYNAVSCIVFAFCAYGILLWGKTIPNALSVVMLPANVFVCLLVFLRWICRAAYRIWSKAANNTVDGYRPKARRARLRTNRHREREEEGR